jgi:Zn finger protein HypA/HybF involved in hydrogenase expression
MSNLSAQFVMTFFFAQGLLVPLALLLVSISYFVQRRQLKILNAIALKSKTKERYSVRLLENLPVLQPLKCQNCAAAVVLGKTKMHCPYCQTQSRLPTDYVAAMKLKLEVKKGFKKAMAALKTAKHLTHPLVYRLFTLLGFLQPAIIWFMFEASNIVGKEGFWLSSYFDQMAVQFGFSKLETGYTVVAFSIISFMLCIGLIGIYWGLAIGITSLRKEIPELPSVSFIRSEQMFDQCRNCGGGVVFSSNDFACICSYCNTENYRAQFTQNERTRQASDLLANSAFLFEALHITLRFTRYFAVATCFLYFPAICIAGVNSLQVIRALIYIKNQ